MIIPIALDAYRKVFWKYTVQKDKEQSYGPARNIRARCHHKYNITYIAQYKYFDKITQNAIITILSQMACILSLQKEWNHFPLHFDCIIVRSIPITLVAAGFKLQFSVRSRQTKTHARTVGTVHITETATSAIRHRWSHHLWSRTSPCPCGYVCKNEWRPGNGPQCYIAIVHVSQNRYNNVGGQDRERCDYVRLLTTHSFDTCAFSPKNTKSYPGTLKMRSRKSKSWC